MCVKQIKIPRWTRLWPSAWWERLHWKVPHLSLYHHQQRQGEGAHRVSPGLLQELCLSNLQILKDHLAKRSWQSQIEYLTWDLIAEPWVFQNVKSVHLSDQKNQGRSDFKTISFQYHFNLSQWLYHTLPKINWHLLHDVSVLKRHLTSLIESYFCRLCVCQTGPLVIFIQDLPQHTDYCEGVNFKSMLLPDHLPLR